MRLAYHTLLQTGSENLIKKFGLGNDQGGQAGRGRREEKKRKKKEDMGPSWAKLVLGGASGLAWDKLKIAQGWGGRGWMSEG